MSDSDPAPFRVFLVVVDESQEMRNALRFACRRAQHSGGRVALLYVIEPVGFQEWLGVGRRIEEEARTEAERRLQQLAGEVVRQTGLLPALHLREGDLATELLQVLQESPEISLLVLGTDPEGNNPGPLVTYVIANSQAFPVPVTLVPGQLTEQQIDTLS